jgi:hypothetical protein
VASAWVGIQALDSNADFLVLQNGELKQNGGVPGHGGDPGPVPFYEINVLPPAGSGKSAYNAFFATGGDLNIGVYYEYDQEYDSGSDTVHFNFGGANKYNLDLSNQCHSGDCQNVPYAGGHWQPTLAGETTSYSTQMPGTLNNTETWTSLQLRHGSPSSWDPLTTQNWSTSGQPSFQQETNGVPLNDPTSTEVHASFKNAYQTYQGYPYVTAYDTCTTH